MQAFFTAQSITLLVLGYAMASRLLELMVVAVAPLLLLCSVASKAVVVALGSRMVSVRSGHKYCWRGSRLLRVGISAVVPCGSGCLGGGAAAAPFEKPPENHPALCHPSASSMFP